MKYIVTESQSLKIKLLRRLHQINDELVLSCCELINTYFRICVYKQSFFYENVEEQIVVKLIRKDFSGNEYTSEDRANLSVKIRNFVKEHYSKLINNFYNNKCEE